MTAVLPSSVWPTLLVLAGCSVDPTQLVVGEIAASPVDDTIVVAGPLAGRATFGSAGEVAPTGQNVGVFLYSFAP